MDTKLFVRRQAGGMFAVIDKSITTGDIFWVDSGSATGADAVGYGQSPDAPFLSIDYAVGQTTASSGDRIYVMPGHAETVSAAAGLALDKAGITIEFLGEGNARGSINFGTAGTADMDVDAADVSLINPRFVAAIDALAGPIDVNAARFKMKDATWQDGTTINTTDCLVADANADDMTIDGFEFIDGNAAGTQKQSFVQVAGATRPVIKRVKCTGDFATGNIENGTAWIDAYLEDLELDNANAGPVVAILLQATSSGQAHRVHVRVASGNTYVTANNDMQWYESFGTGTDATAGEKIGTILSGDIEGKVDSVGTQASTAVSTGTILSSKATSTGTKASAAASVGTVVSSKATSIGTKASTVISTGTIVSSKATSVGNAVSSRATSVGTKTSTAVSTGTVVSSKATSVGTKASTAVSLGTVVSSKATSVGTKASTVISTGTIVNSKATSIGTQVLRNIRQSTVSLAAANFTGTVTRYTIANGPILVRHLGLRITTALAATAANTLIFSFTPTVGVATNLCGATDVDAAIAEQLFVVDGVKNTGLVKATDAGIMVAANEHMPIVLSAGILQTIFSAGPPATGAGVLFMEWEPLNPSATVT